MFGGDSRPNMKDAVLRGGDVHMAEDEYQDYDEENAYYHYDDEEHYGEEYDEVDIGDDDDDEPPPPELDEAG